MVKTSLFFMSFFFFLSAKGLPLDEIYGSPSGRYFDRNINRLLQWIEKENLGVFRDVNKDDYLFFQSCLKKIKTWYSTAENQTKLASYSWMLPTSTTDQNDLFRCVLNEKIQETLLAKKFANRWGSVSPPKNADWVGIEWSRKNKSWKLIYKNDGFLYVDKTSTTSFSNIHCSSQDEQSISSRFPEPRAIQKITCLADNHTSPVLSAIIDLKTYYIYWAPESIRSLIEKVHSEFGYIIREVFWQKDSTMRVSVP